MKETLKSMKETLISHTHPQVTNLQCADYEELGAAIDMIKDLEEALYYCAVTEAMEKTDEEKEMMRKMMPAENNNTYYYTERYLPMYEDPYYRDMDRMTYGKMYYTGSGNNSSGSSGGMSGVSNSNSSGRSTSNYSDHYDNSQSKNNEEMNWRPNSYYEYPMQIRDQREGRSPISRRMYMESKTQHPDKNKQLKELETYMQELTQDITEMISGASPEEKQMLQKKLSMLSAKIEQMN